MGLDMYLKGRKLFAYEAETRQEEGFEVEAIEVKLGYWRKHPDLHGFIVHTFANDEDNCQEIELDTDQLAVIIEAVKAQQLPKTDGFFFGASARGTNEKGEPTAEAAKELQEQTDEDLEILGKAVSWLTRFNKHEDKCWYSVIYRASW